MAGEHKNVDITLDNILGEVTARRHTKVVCTIGRWKDVPTLVKMIQAGMDVCRLNFSHGSHEDHGVTVDNVREAARLTGRQIPIMLDTKGPEIRTGFLKDHREITLTAGQELILSTDYSALGDTNMITCSYEALPRSVKPGQTVLAADGSVMMTVTEILDGAVRVKVLNNAKLGEKKNMNLPGVIVELPTVTEKDKSDIVDFAVERKLDYIAASFVRKGSDIDVIRELMGPAGRGIQIIAKIENHEGLQNFDDILEKADSIMVARGDLGMELWSEKVFLAQKMMIRKCNLAGKPVITATQMLESMIEKPRPTRAECTDIANAVLDGSDAVMLSGETASGNYPLEAIDVMSKVCVEAEAVMDYKQRYFAMETARLSAGPMSVQEAIASSAVKTAMDIGAKLIIVCTETGTTARLVAKYVPAVPILALCSSDIVARQVEGLVRNASAEKVESMLGTDHLLQHTVERLVDAKVLNPGDFVVAVHGQIEARMGSTNLCKVLVAPEL